MVMDLNHSVRLAMQDIPKIGLGMALRLAVYMYQCITQQIPSQVQVLQSVQLQPIIE
jgi:hypothetical protein